MTISEPRCEKTGFLGVFDLDHTNRAVQVEA